MLRTPCSLSLHALWSVHMCGMHPQRLSMHCLCSDYTDVYSRLKASMYRSASAAIVQPAGFEEAISLMNGQQ